MKRSLKYLMSALTALILPALGWAETTVPTATWTDFNTLTSGNFTLTKADACTVNTDGSITLGGAGLQYTFVDGDGMVSDKTVSIVLDVTIPESITDTMHLVNVKHTGGNAIGVATTSNILQTLWNQTTGSRVAKAWTPSGRKRIAVTYSGSNGTDVYVDGFLVATDTALRTTGSNLGVLTIGAYHDGTQPATGMVVHSMKLFTSKIGEDDIETYSFIDSMAWRVRFNDANTTEGWFAGWGDQNESAASYVDTLTGRGYKVVEGRHPWTDTAIPQPFSIALYANVSEIVNTDDKKAIIIALGDSGSNFVLAKTAANQIAVCIGDVIVGDLHIEDEDIAVTGSYHLIVFGTDGTKSFLQVDGTKVSGTHDSAPTWNNGLQIGSMFKGIDSAIHVKGFNMIVDEVRGYSAALDDTALAKLKAKYPEYTPVNIEVSETTNYSDLDLTKVSSLTPLTLTLKPGAVLTLDQAPALRELNIVSEGTAESPATIKTTAEVTNPFVNAESAKITGGETKIPAAMYFSDSVNLSALSSVTLVAADDATAEAPQTIETAINVTSGKTMKLEGYFTLSGSNQVQSGGTLVINSGKTTLTTAKQGIKGTLTIAKDATLTNVTTDGLAHDTAGVVVNVYGTLDLNTTRWTIFANNNTLNLYAGATVTGAGQDTNGAVDVWEKTTDSVAINVLKNGDDASDVTLSAELRCRSGKTVFNIAEGVTAVINNDNNPGTNGGGIKVTGAGTLKITSANTYSGGTIVDTDATLVVANASALGSGSVSGTGMIVVDAITLDAAGYTEFSGSYGVQNSGTLIVAAGKEGTIDVPAGSTVKLVLNDVLFAAGYTASGVTGEGTIAFYKDGDLGTVVQSGNTYGGSGAIWTPKAADSAWDTCWNVTEVPTSGDIAINTSNVEADISVTIPNNFSKITVNAHAEYITTITFADGITAAPLNVAGKVKLPIAVINGVAVAVEVDSILIADVAENVTAPLSKALSGNYAFWKGGAGTLELGADVNVDDGVEVLAGTLKFGAGLIPGKDGNSYPTTKAGDVKVHGGATFDINGKADAFLNMVTLCKDAIFANDSTTALTTNSRQLKGITLEGDATIRTSKDFGLVASGHIQSTLNLGNHKMTKEGDGLFLLCNAEVKNGTLTVVAGKISCQTVNASYENVTFESDLADAFALGTGDISGTVTKKGTCTMAISGPISGDLTIEAGTLELPNANTHTGSVTIADGAILVSTFTADATLPAHSGTGTVIKKGSGTAYVKADTACESHIIVNEGTLNYDEDADYAKTYNLSIEKGATLFVSNAFASVTSADNVIRMKGGAKLKMTNGNSWASNRPITASYIISEATDDNPVRIEGSSNGNVSNVSGSITGNGVVALYQSGNVYNVSANITDGENEGDAIKVKAMTGTVNLTGTNTYTGGTEISAGANLALGEGATLGNGDITIAGAVSGTLPVASGATLSGSGTISGALALDAGATLDATAETKLSVTGDVTFGDTLTVKLATAPTEGTPVAILSKTGLSAADVANVALSVVIGEKTFTGSHKLVTTDAGYAVALDITVPGNIVIDGVETSLDAEAQAVLLAIAKDNSESIMEVKAGDAEKAAYVNDALQVFDAGIVTVDGGEATVDWHFGITDIVRDPENMNQVIITAKVLDMDGDAAGFADNVTVALVDGDENAIATATPSSGSGGMVTFTVPLANLLDKNKNAKPITVKASK